jgi:hypothetical protein
MTRTRKQLIFLLIASGSLYFTGCETVTVNYKSNVDSDHSEILDQTEVNPATEVGLLP